MELERVLGTPALFATAYGNVGSSIYYALGVTAVFALGLTPLVFVIAGVIFACTAATYAEGTVRYPEAGGSSSFARHGFNELVSFGAAWAQMLNYIITIAISAFFVPHYLSIFWEPLKDNPWDIVVGIAVILVLVVLNIVGIQEAAKLNILLAVIDFATQLLLVLLGFFLIFNIDVLGDNVHWGVAPTWSNFAIAIPVGMIAYTGIETVSNLAEEARDPARSIPASIRLVAIAVFAIYFTLPAIALSALPVKEVDGEFVTLLGLGPDEGGFSNDPVLGLVENLGLSGVDARRAQDLRGPARRHDPLHRDECGRDRRVADHVCHGELPATARGVSPAASPLQDAVALAHRLRRRDLDPGDPAGTDGLPGHDVLVRRNALVHGRARLDRGAPRARARTRSRSSAPGRTCASAGSTCRSSRFSAGLRPAARGSSSSSRKTRRGGPGSAGSRSASPRMSSTGAATSTAPLTETVRLPPAYGPALALEYRRLLVPVVPGQASDDALDVAAGLATERGAQIAAVTVLEIPLDLPLGVDLPEEEEQANRELDEARAIGDSYGVSVIPRLVRGRNAGAEIVREAERRGTEIIVIGAPRRDLGRRKRAVFGNTVDHVLKNAPCRVMVVAPEGTAT